MNVTIHNGRTYTSTKVMIGKTTWGVMKVENVDGSLDYVNVTKYASWNRGIGKDFKSFDEAVRNYKSPAIKAAILYAELNIQTQ